jgi:hypothetical protein
MPKGTILTDSHKNVVKDVFGEPILCKGGWNDPENVQSFLTAIRCMHDGMNNTGPYLEPCNACISRRADGESTGCDDHTTGMFLRQQGNPVDTETVKAAYKKSTKTGRGYRSQGDSALSPFDVADIRGLFSTKLTLDFKRVCNLVIRRLGRWGIHTLR